MLNNRMHGCRCIPFSSGGNDYLIMENDRLKLTFWLNKGADLIELRDKERDINALWRSPLRMPAAGQYIAPSASELGSFFDYYPGGWQEVFPNSHTPTNDYKGAPLGLHGEACLLPWQYSVVEDTAEKLSVRLEVCMARTPFRLQKRVTLKAGERGFELEETITNEGEEALYYNWGHHPTFGAPLLEEGCRIDLPPNTVAVTPGYVYSKTARFAEGQRAEWPILREKGGRTAVDAGIVPGRERRTSDSFHLELPEGWVGLRNPRLDLGVGLAWDHKMFPYLWMWQAYGGSEGYPFYGRDYTIALEPFTNPIQTLPESIADGHARELMPRESVRTVLWAGLIGGQQPVKHIDALTGLIST